jgi:hypothetical protein
MGKTSSNIINRPGPPATLPPRPVNTPDIALPRPLGGK